MLKNNLKIPLVPLRDVVVFPYMVIPIFVGRDASVASIEAAMETKRQIAVLTQKEPGIETPKENDLYKTGVLAEVLQLLKLPDGTLKVLIEGVCRIQMKKLLAKDGVYMIEYSNVDESALLTKENKALMRNVYNLFEEYIKLNRRVPPEIVMTLSNIDNPGHMADIVTANIMLKIKEKQELLEMFKPEERLLKLSKILSSEIEILNIEKKIRDQVRGQMEDTQKEYYLNEQLKAIKKELGHKDDSFDDLDDLKKTIKKSGMPKEVEEKAKKELTRLKKMSPYSAEATVVRNYLDWLIELPWSKESKDMLDIKKAEVILDEDHYGLKKAKERIIEYLAVCKLVKKFKGPILCFVGPPGTGKTSVAKSIARAMERKFVRLSLGGVRDEAEIRGHRRTYVGALPGRIIQSLHKVETKNPVFLLDEIDKMSVDFRGDPSAALLEVLDPEQNFAFSDHYLEVEFDLSNIMFITTANNIYSIPIPLRDRMEIINFAGYTEHEKLMILKKHIYPKQIKDHGLDDYNVSVTDEAVIEIIQHYTKEAGVRNLERELSNILRKIAKKIAEGKLKNKKFTINKPSVQVFLGVPKYRTEIPEKKGLGVATGLAWTEYGGTIMSIETVVAIGKGEIILTGRLGDVMKESARAAITYIKKIGGKYKLTGNFLKNKDIHIHVPEGAIPKDGPSAGITMCVAILSALTKRSVKTDIAMTGEITLRGKVLPIGGVKEKILGATRSGIYEIILPDENQKDIEEIEEKHILKKVKIHFVKKMEDVLKLVLK